MCDNYVVTIMSGMLIKIIGNITDRKVLLRFNSD